MYDTIQFRKSFIKYVFLFEMYEIIQIKILREMFADRNLIMNCSHHERLKFILIIFFCCNFCFFKYFNKSCYVMQCLCLWIDLNKFYSFFVVVIFVSKVVNFFVNVLKMAIQPHSFSPYGLAHFRFCQLKML